MKFVTRMAFRNHPGNTFHEIKLAVFAKFCLLVRVLVALGQFDFMKFVTLMAFQSHPGNTFHEITLVVFARLCLLVCVIVAFGRPI